MKNKFNLNTISTSPIESNWKQHLLGRQITQHSWAGLFQTYCV